MSKIKFYVSKKEILEQLSYLTKDSIEFMDAFKNISDNTKNKIIKEILKDEYLVCMTHDKIVTALEDNKKDINVKLDNAICDR